MHQTNNWLMDKIITRLITNENKPIGTALLEYKQKKWTLLELKRLVNWSLVYHRKIFFQTKMSNIWCFQLLKRENSLFFLVLHCNKLNIFQFCTVKNNSGRGLHRKLDMLTCALTAMAFEPAQNAVNSSNINCICRFWQPVSHSVHVRLDNNTFKKTSAILSHTVILDFDY